MWRVDVLQLFGMFIQPIAFGVPFNPILQSQSNGLILTVDFLY